MCSQQSGLCRLPGPGHSLTIQLLQLQPQHANPLQHVRQPHNNPDPASQHHGPRSHWQLATATKLFTGDKRVVMCTCPSLLLRQAVHPLHIAWGSKPTSVISHTITWPAARYLRQSQQASHSHFSVTLSQQSHTRLYLGGAFLTTQRSGFGDAQPSRQCQVLPKRTHWIAMLRCQHAQRSALALWGLWHGCTCKAKPLCTWQVPKDKQRSVHGPTYLAIRVTRA